jgi:hypothetical protein
METLTSYVAQGGAIVRGHKGYSVQLTQTLLNVSGACLTTDGIFGGATEDAVRAFQARTGIVISGRVGSTTASALDALAPPTVTPRGTIPSCKADVPWLTTMRAVTGQREYPGAPDSPFILGMAGEIAERYPDLTAYCKEYRHDSTPWCGLMIAYVMAVNDNKPVTKEEGAKYGFLWADDWKYFGVHCPPMVGAVGVFTRSGGGHVALIEGWNDTHYFIRGGNQADMVNVTTILKTKLTDTRWPATWPKTIIVGQTSMSTDTAKFV